MSVDVLLEIQEHDTASDRLRHRHATLSERDDYKTARADLGVIEVERNGIDEHRVTVARDEARLDDEATTVKNHAADVERKLYSGETNSPKELQALQADLDQLKTQQRRIEDRELEVMEQREVLEAAIAAGEARIAVQRTETERLGTVLTAREQEIEAELAEEADARAALAAQVDPDLLGTYEKCRERAGGIGAARLIGRACQGCHLDIPAVEADRIRKSDGVIAHCDNCGAILVP